MPRENDPYAQFNFLIVIDNVTAGGFTEASGLTTEQDVIEYREGNETARMRKLPGLAKFNNIMLKRGVVSDELWQWRKTTLDGNTERRDGQVILMDETRNPVMAWNFFEGWLCKFEGPTLNSTTNEVATESIEICYEFLEMEIL
jgi:phage tail-like protein